MYPPREPVKNFAKRTADVRGLFSARKNRRKTVLRILKGEKSVLFYKERLSASVGAERKEAKRGTDGGKTRLPPIKKAANRRLFPPHFLWIPLYANTRSICFEANFLPCAPFAFSFLEIFILPVCSYDFPLSLKAFFFFLPAVKRRGRSLFFPIKEKFFRPPKKTKTFISSHWIFGVTSGGKRHAPVFLLFDPQEIVGRHVQDLTQPRKGIQSGKLFRCAVLRDHLGRYP